MYIVYVKGWKECVTVKTLLINIIYSIYCKLTLSINKITCTVN